MAGETLSGAVLLQGVMGTTPQHSESFIELGADGQRDRERCSKQSSTMRLTPSSSEWKRLLEIGDERPSDNQPSPEAQKMTSVDEALLQLASLLSLSLSLSL